MRRRVAAALATALIAAGCGGGVDGEATMTVYVSTPMHGPDRAAGRDIPAGAELALADSDAVAGGVEIEAVVLDNTARERGGRTWTQAQVGANARTATRDSTTIAYVGELTAAATLVSLPITNAAGIPQVSAGDSAPELVRDEPFNDEVPSRVQTSGERTFVSVVGRNVEGRPARPLEPGELPLAGLRIVRELEATLGRPPGPYAAYGYEAMALLLDAIGRAADPTDRSNVSDALLETGTRESAVGRYVIDADTGEAVRPRETGPGG